MLNIIIKDIMEYVEIEESSLTESTNPVTDLHLNSYDFISLIGRLESELGIAIPERELRKLETLGDLDVYIREKMLK